MAKPLQKAQQARPAGRFPDSEIRRCGKPLHVTCQSSFAEAASGCYQVEEGFLQLLITILSIFQRDFPTPG
jgi:hypothetical protein